MPGCSEAVYCRRSTANCPQAVRQSIAGAPLPTAPRQWNSALQEVHCPLLQGSEAVYCTTSIATDRRHWGSALQEGRCPLAPGSEAVNCRRSAAHCPQAVRQCMAGGKHSAPRQWDSSLQEVHCPLPPGSEAVYCRRSTAHCPQALGQCIAGGPMPTGPGQ